MIASWCNPDSRRGVIRRLGQPLHPGDPQGDRHHPPAQSRSHTYNTDFEDLENFQD